MDVAMIAPRSGVPYFVTLPVPCIFCFACNGIAEGCGWKTSLENKPAEAPCFYGVIGTATAIGLLMNFFHVDLVKALVWAAALNGLVAAPLMAIIMLMESSKKVMGKFKVRRYLLWAGWLATAAMGCVCVGLFVTRT